MGFKGKFDWYVSLRSGGRKAIAFTLTCDNMFQSETFDCAIMGAGAAPMYFRNQTLKAKQSLTFSFDTVDWQWCNGDTFVILGKNDSIKAKWPLSLRMYAPGECPDCHGTHRCRKCSGKGFINVPGHSIEQCDICYGTGICQRCYVPQRNAGPSPAQNPAAYGQLYGNPAKERQVEGLRRQIADLQSKIEKTQWDMRMLQLKDMDRTNPSVYMSYNQLLHRYNIQMIELQSRLEQLERMQ